MTDQSPAPYSLMTRPCVVDIGRFRWDIYDNDSLFQTSAESFDTEEEAVNLANDTKYGLAASIWTTNLKRGHRVAQQMNVGITWLNCWFLRDLRTPFGGVGLSGIGREGGIHSLNFYSELNNICVRL